MRHDDAVFWALLVVLASQRLVELVTTRRNLDALVREGAVAAKRDGFGYFVAIHAAMFVLLAAEWFWAPWSGLHAATPLFLGLFVLAGALRYWAAASLGRFYTVRVVRLPGAAPVATGPYRWMRHPIYRALIVEVPAVPFALGAWLTAAVLGAANLAALQYRIRKEEAHWRPGGA